MAWYPIMGNKTKMYYLGQGTSFNIQSLLPNIDYTSLTASNFIIEPNSAEASRDQNADVGSSKGMLTVNKSYNAETGVLSASAVGYFSTYYDGAMGSQSASSSVTASVKAYLVLGDIKQTA